MSNGSSTPDELRPDRVIDSDELIARIVEYDEALAAGHTLDFKQDETVQKLPNEAQARLFGIFDCLEFLDRVRRVRCERAADTGISPEVDGRSSAEAGKNGVLLKIGRFEVVRELGRGGHGVVFLANDPLLRRQVALKVPRPEFLLSSSMSRRFLGEARAGAALDHPNILRVFEVGSDGAICYIAQELCAGPSLAEWLREQVGKVDPGLTAEIVRQLAKGVEHAHQAGILHRDLKPANALLQPVEGQAGCSPHGEQAGSLLRFVPKLADFGIAKIFDEESDRTATLTGTAIGTVAYMSPEQAAGKTSEIGSPSDVYGLGAILYELLTGRPPFEVGSHTGVMETLQKIIAEEPTRPRALRSELPADLEAICLKCLEKSPADRYATAGKLAVDLERFLNGESVSVRPAGPLLRAARRLRRQPLSVLIAFAAIALLVGALGMTVIWAGRGTIVGQSPGPPPNREAEYINGIERVSQGYFDAVANRGDVKTAVRELDTFLVRHRPQSGEADYRGFEWHYLWRLCHPDQVAQPFPKLFDLVGHKGEVYFVAFSPDGRRIATAGQDHTGRIWDAATGKLVANLIGHTDDVNWISFYPEAGINHVLTASDDKTVRIWDCEDGKLESVLEDGAPVVAVEIARSLYPEQPDQILTCDDLGQLRVWDWVSRRLMRTIPAHSQRIHALTPIRGRNWWLTASSDGTVKEWDYLNWEPMRMHVVDSVDFRGASASIFSASCNTQATLAAFGWGWSPITGRAGLAPSRDLSGNMQQGSITIDDLLTGTRWLQLTGAAAFCYECVRFYPGQCALVSTCRDKTSHGGSEHEVVYWDLPTQKFWNPFDGIHPPSWCAAFASDGTRMATAGNDGTVRVWDSSMLPGGNRLDSLDGGLKKWPSTARFSPDGRRLLVTYAGDQRSNDGHSFVIWDVSGPRPKPIYLEPMHGDLYGSLSGCFSPDGGLIAVDTSEWSSQKSRSRIRLLDAESMREIKRFDGYENFARRILVSPDGKYIVAVTGDRRGLHEQLNVWKADSSTPATVFPESSQPRDCLATTLSPDGKLLATSHGRVQIYDFPSLRLSSTLPFRLGPVGALRFSPDGQVLAAGGDGGTIHLWDRGSGKELATLRSDGHAVLSLAFSPDGTRLAVGLDGAARVDVWHLPTRKRLTPLSMPTDLASVTDLNFSPDQRTLAAVGVGGNGGVFLFPLEPVDTLAMKSQP